MERLQPGRGAAGEPACGKCFEEIHTFSSGLADTGLGARRRHTDSRRGHIQVRDGGTYVRHRVFRWKRHEHARAHNLPHAGPRLHRLSLQARKGQADEKAHGGDLQHGRDHCLDLPAPGRVRARDIHSRGAGRDGLLPGGGHTAALRLRPGHGPGAQLRRDI